MLAHMSFAAFSFDATVIFRYRVIYYSFVRELLVQKQFLPTVTFPAFGKQLLRIVYKT